MKLIVGLGNPGRKYRDTKHNIGFICLDAFAEKHKLKFKYEKKFKADFVKTANFILLKPQTYMNLSGISVQAAMSYFNLDPSAVLIIHDDLDLPIAKLRLRYQGSAGGHNGLKSIISSIQSESFRRVKFGIDQHLHMDTKDYVLSKFKKDEIPAVKEAITKTVDIIERFTQDEAFNALMNHYN